MRKIFLMVAVILVVLFAGGILYWYFVLSQKSASIGTPSPTPTPVKKSGGTLGEIVLCKDFQKIEGEITCEDALGIAKAKYHGRVKSIAPGRTLPQKDSSDSKIVDIWRIDIFLDNPVKKDQEIFEGARIFIDRETGSEIRSGYLQKS